MVYFHLIESQEGLILIQLTTFLPFTKLRTPMVFSLQTKHTTFLLIQDPSFQDGYDFILE